MTPMTQPLFPSAKGTQPRHVAFVRIGTTVRKGHGNGGQTGSRCLDGAVLAQGGGGYRQST